MSLSLEQCFIESLHQSLVENATVLRNGNDHPFFWRALKRGSPEVYFVFDGDEIRGWSKTRKRDSGGRKRLGSGQGMQFLSEGR